MKIVFPGGKKVAVEFEGKTVLTDQPKAAGGGGEAPAPFELFLASIGACAGYFVLSFCQKRGISTDGVELVQDVVWNEKEHRVDKIAVDIVLPETFPEKYRAAVVAAAELCTVKRHLLAPPKLEVRARSRAAL